MALVLACVLPVVACSKDPVATSQAMTKRGDAFVAEKKPAEATIEYRRAIAANPKNGEARLALAKLLSLNDDFANATAEYVRAADLLPQNLDAQLKAGRVLLVVGRFDDARGRADKALKLDPRNVDAQILKGNALAGLKEFDAAVRQVESAIAADPSSGVGYANLGALQLARGDSGAALGAFKRAVAREPQSVSARLALANYYWSVSQREETEQTLKEAVALQPKDLLANRALALFYMGSPRKAEAETPLKVFAEVGPKPDGMLALADFYASQQRYQDAKAVLDRLGADPKGVVPAKLRLASLGLLTGDRAEAYRLMDDVLKTNPKELDALVGKARMKAADGKLDEALTSAKAAVASNPASPQAQHTLGIVLVALDQSDAGATAFKEALRLNPDFAPAQVDLGKLALSQGRNGEAIQMAESAVKNSPGYGDAYLLLARAQFANKNPAAAERPLKVLQESSGSNPIVQTEVGRLYLTKGDRAKARASFEQAFRKDSSELGALQSLVMMDLQDHKPDAAQARVEAAEKAAPTNASLKVMAGRIYAGNHDLQRAEQTLKQAVELSPNNMQAYVGLAQVYVMEKRLPEATAEFERLAQREPKSATPLTVAGVLLQIQNKTAEAKAHFQRAIEINPLAGVAANNLAWIYAESNENLDTALQLAQTAKAQIPNRHEVDDTLGLVYYKKGLSTLAVSAFQRSVQLQPDNPSYVGHLGLAYAQNGDKDKARQSLERALKLKADFDGSDEARKVLKSIVG
ncbi:MAG TPA: tetratricopeptide repeat protein [Vicinamibacterales bacterium]|nr:tetratricopeptide repeat protein [Vicinamibacterales bacterium]